MKSEEHSCTTSNCKHIKASNSGYTLLETLIAFSILLVAAVPMVNYLFKLSGGNDSEKAITGMCLLEQEVAIAKAFPERVLPVKRRMVKNKEWIIKTEVNGSELLHYRMIISDGKRERGKILFYGRNDN